MLPAAAFIQRHGQRTRQLVSLTTSAASRGLASRSVLPAAVQNPVLVSSAGALQPHQPLPASQPIFGSRGIASAVFAARGGAFVLRARVPDAVGPDSSRKDVPSSLRLTSTLPQTAGAGRSLSTSRAVFCNLLTSDLDESPFGQAPESEEDEEEEVMVASVGGTLLYGNKAATPARPAAPKTTQSLGPVRWIGDSSHSGDWTAASTKLAQEQPTVWSQIIGACREDPERLKATVAMLHSAAQKHNTVPPLPAFNKLLELCSKTADMTTVHQMVEIMSSHPEELVANDDTHKWLDACFAYNNRERT